MGSVSLQACFGRDSHHHWLCQSGCPDARSGQVQFPNVCAVAAWPSREPLEPLLESARKLRLRQRSNVLLGFLLSLLSMLPHPDCRCFLLSMCGIPSQLCKAQPAPAAAGNCSIEYSQLQNENEEPRPSCTPN